MWYSNRSSKNGSTATNPDDKKDIFVYEDVFLAPEQATLRFFINTAYLRGTFRLVHMGIFI